MKPPIINTGIGAIRHSNTRIMDGGTDKNGWAGAQHRGGLTWLVSLVKIETIGFKANRRAIDVCGISLAIY